MLQILRKLKHENIIEMLDSFESPQEFCVVTEFAQVMICFLDNGALYADSAFIQILQMGSLVLCNCLMD